MTNQEKVRRLTALEEVRRLTALEEHLLQAWSALAAVLDDAEALGEVTVLAFDLADPDRRRTVESEVNTAQSETRRALNAVRERLQKLGAMG